MEGDQSSLVTLSSARGHVLDAVKRRGEASADEVAKSLGITPSAVRQHLATLKSGGLVASRQERGRSGRPTDLYHTTELGETLFGGPSTVDLTVELLGFVEDEDPELVARVFERRQRERVAQCQGQLADKSLAAKVAGLAEILDAEGYMADVDPLPDGYRLSLHRCAIWAVATRFGLACSTELEFLEEVVPEADITRVAHKVAGGFVCSFEIRPTSSKSRTPSLQLRRRVTLT
jgi:DeoR family suf operon transcriptional repressor